MEDPWYKIRNVDEIPSPALIVYSDRVEKNIQEAIRIAGDGARLRPHIKTHKMPKVIQLHLRAGVEKFKCATIAEAEMAAEAGAKDVLLASQPVGPNAQRFGKLVRAYPDVKFATIIDNAGVVAELDREARAISAKFSIYLDVDCGMRRTGIPVGREAADLYKLINGSGNLETAGLHVYDGHIHEVDLGERERLASEAWKAVEQFRRDLTEEGMKAPGIVAGGTPTFGFHAKNPAVECSPGTYVFWDFGYEALAEYKFSVAALLITRVISKPGKNRLCLDLGHKAIASENPQPRARLLNLPQCTVAMHNEEHLVIDTPEAEKWRPGDVLYAVPRHVCPTVALHDFAWVARNGRVSEQWKTTARARHLSI
jgi:D-serine deaminase-like pyridoxal phosphate-dependent protein